MGVGMGMRILGRGEGSGNVENGLLSETRAMYGIQEQALHAVVRAIETEACYPRRSLYIERYVF
jgi:hypothetical protein